MPAPYFFGYGSLVNRTTHDYTNSSQARLDGWRRVWRHTDEHPTAYLSVEQVEGGQIDGLIAHVPDGDWAALDTREIGYERFWATPDVIHDNGSDIDIAVYKVPRYRQGDQTGLRPIQLSYIDVVVQGFLGEFGPKGVARFFETTHGWETPVLNDRAAPRYPRHQKLSKSETALVDDHLAALSVRFVTSL